jgi:3-methylcrotonyl-CoA carboxylase alpha subunit
VADHGEALAGEADAAEQASFAGAALLASHAPRGERASPWDAADGFRVNLPARVTFRLKRGKDSFDVAATPLSRAEIAASCGGARVDVAVSARDGVLLRLSPFDARDAVDALVSHGRVTVWRGAESATFVLDDPRDVSASSQHVAGSLATPLPGVVIRVAVKPGDRVKAGDTLVVVEAMKMEHAIRAPHDGVVKSIKHAAGDRVPEGAALIELDPAG